MCCLRELNKDQLTLVHSSAISSGPGDSQYPVSTETDLFVKITNPNFRGLFQTFAAPFKF